MHFYSGKHINSPPFLGTIVRRTSRGTMLHRFNPQGRRHEFPSWTLKWVLLALLILYFVYPLNQTDHALALKPSIPSKLQESTKKQQELGSGAQSNNLIMPAKAPIHPLAFLDHHVRIDRKAVEEQKMVYKEGLMGAKMSSTEQSMDVMEEKRLSNSSDIMDVDNAEKGDLKLSHQEPRHIPCSVLDDKRACLPEVVEPAPNCDTVKSVDNFVGGSKHPDSISGCQSKESEGTVRLRGFQSMGTQAVSSQTLEEDGGLASETMCRNVESRDAPVAVTDPSDHTYKIHLSLITSGRPTISLKVNELTRCIGNKGLGCWVLGITLEQWIFPKDIIECRAYKHRAGVIPGGTTFTETNPAIWATNGYIQSILCYVRPQSEVEQESKPLTQSRSLEDNATLVHQKFRRAFSTWSDYIHAKQCETEAGYTQQDCEQHQIALYIMYFVIALTSFCAFSWFIFRCVQKNKRRAPMLINYKSESEQSLVRSQPMMRVRTKTTNLNRAVDEEAQMGTERFVGLDGAADGWTKWMKPKQRPQISDRFSPPLKAYTPRLPSLVLPRTTLATVRQLSGLVRIRGSEAPSTMRETIQVRPKPLSRDVTRLKWGSTV